MRSPRGWAMAPASNFDLLVAACESLGAARVAHFEALAEIDRLVRLGIEAGCPPDDMREVVADAMSAAAIRRAPERAGSR